MSSANISTTHFQPHYSFHSFIQIRAYMMDWFTWLSKTGLDPTLVYEYGQSFSQNELEQDDIPYFNHEFLQSMGISIAKHRLEILKLARKDKNALPRPMSRILVAIKRTKRCFSKCITRAWGREKTSLALVPARSYSATTWRKGLLKRGKKGSLVNKNSRAPLLLTNGTSMMFHSARIESLSSPMGHDDHDQRDDDDDGDDDGDVKCDGDEYDEYWSSAVEEIRWDAMFQNLKPT